MNNDSVFQWLNNRHINAATLEQFGIHWDTSIVIPINDEDGTFLFNKHRRNPFNDTKGPKYWYDKQGTVQLYGAEFIKDKKTVVYCEGELDALVLWSHNIPAVTSTGGAMSWQEKWTPLLLDKEVYVCLDNDEAGAAGTVRVLESLPHAKVILLPNTAQIKDITEYFTRGGDFRALMDSAKTYATEEEVLTDMNPRKGKMESTLFHEAWLENHEKKTVQLKPVTRSSSEDEVERAKSVEIKSLVKVGRDRKALCPFHNDKTPSMHVFPDNHAFCFVCHKRADTIDIYRALNNCTFKEAVEALNRL